MTGYCQYALKEWSVTMDSLLAGRQICCFARVASTNNTTDFTLNTSEFFLFPTHVHQSLHALHPSFQTDLDQSTAPKLQQ